MESLLTFLADGLLLGFVYGVAAIGMTLIWGVMKVINLSHNVLIAYSMFGVYLLFNNLGINPYLAIILVAGLGLLLGILIYLIAVHRVIDAPELCTLLATFSVSMIMTGVGTAVWTTSPRNIEFSLGSFSLGPVTLPVTRAVAALAAALATAGLYLFLYRTRPGRYIRAVANNREAAEMVGVPSNQILALSFGLGAMLASIAGGLIATFFPFNILGGMNYQLKSFVIGVLGGLGNPIGALVGGLILGTLEGVIPIFMETSWVPVFEFGLFVLTIIFRPSGLLGAKQ
ncbi:MAG: branched-chain amino acid ABC transporter permease [Chloroflexota bacterium]|nr:branched-chain amino acid ABC transporter permease [Chloroflexota bacterium]